MKRISANIQDMTTRTPFLMVHRMTVAAITIETIGTPWTIKDRINHNVTTTNRKSIDDEIGDNDDKSNSTDNDIDGIHDYKRTVV